MVNQQSQPDANPTRVSVPPRRAVHQQPAQTTAPTLFEKV